MQKKLLATLTLILVMILTFVTLSACGANGGNDATEVPVGSSEVPTAKTEGPGTENEATTGEDEAGSKTITIAAATVGATMDPPINTDATVSMLLYATYDRLVKYDVKEENGMLVSDDENMAPSLAKSWVISEDGKTYTFHLDENARFADGTPVEASDVKFTFERSRNLTESQFVFELTNIDTVDTPDNMTVVFGLKEHTPTFLKLIELYDYCILNEDAFNANGGEEYLKKNTIGSGPYEITKYDTSSQVILEARDDYWGKRAKNDKIVINLVPEPSNRQLFLQGGDVDIALDLNETELENIRELPGLKVQSRAMPKVLYFAMNSNIAPFDDVKVRQAIAYAMPYNDLVEGVMYNTVVNPKSFIPTSMPGHIENENTHYEQDLDKARELLAEAGYEDGFEFEFTLGGGFQEWEDTAIVIQNVLESELGITMNINKMERAQFLSDIGTGEVQCFLTRFISFINDPGYLAGILMTEDGLFNYYNYHSEEFDALYEKSTQTIDEEERMEIMAELQELYNEDIPCIFLYEYQYSLCSKDNIGGYVAHTDGSLRLEQLTIE